MIITGGSSGIGKTTADVFAANGYQVYELSRNGKSRGGVVHITCDITQEDRVKEVFKEIYHQEKRMDILINNAGFGISGAVEFTPIQEAERLFQVNFFALASVTKAALPYLRNHQGRVMNISSVAGSLAIPFQSYYSASKAATNALTLGLRNEVRMFDVSLCTLAPGDVQTPFTQKRQKEIIGDDLYQGKIQRSVALMEKDEQSGMSPAYIAKRILAIAKKKRVRPLYTLGKKYQLLSFIADILPVRTVNWLIGKIYAS